MSGNRAAGRVFDGAEVGELVRRLEEVEAYVGREFCRATGEEFPGSGAAWIDFAGGVAASGGRSSPQQTVKGAGVNGPVSEEEIEGMERLFRAVDASPTIDLCPAADEAFVAALGARGFRVAAFESVLFREIRAGEAFEGEYGADVRVEPARSDEVDLCARTIAVGFAGDDPPEFMLRMGRVAARVPGMTMLIARVGGAVAGAGVMGIYSGRAGRTVAMFGSSVLPAFRGRGVQTAMIRARLRMGKAAGCNLAKMDTKVGTTSQRNAERAGFRVAFTRAQLSRPQEDTSCAKSD